MRRQKDLHETLISQPGIESLILVVAGVGADEVYRAFGMGGQPFFVAALGALGVDAAGFVEVGTWVGQ